MSVGVQTAGDLIVDAAADLGLGTINAPYSSQDPAIIQLTRLLNTSGKALYGMHDWEQLTRSYNFTTVAGKTQYQLPDDFGYMVNQTEWTEGQSSGPIPLLGATSQEWSFLGAYESISTGLWAHFKIQRGVMDIYPPDVESGIDVSYEYQSQNWCISSAGWANMLAADTEADAYAIWTAESKRKPTQYDDVILFEESMISALLRLKWLSAKNFPAQDTKDEFEGLMRNWKNKNQPRQSINLNRGFGWWPFLGPQSLPFTGFGDGGD